MRRYWLFQLPGIALVGLLATAGASWFGLPTWTVAVAMGAWIIKDLLMYPLVRSAYDRPGPTGTEAMVGLLGTSVEELNPRGYVKVGAELWRAQSPVQISADRSVRVTACDGMTLWVEPAAEAES